MSPEKKLIYPKYRPDIDGLRAVAVLSVVAFHAFPNYFAGGFVGVDIFFVISGFLISTIIFRSLEDNRFSLIEFFKRRILRIFPPLFLVLVFCYFVGWFFLFSDELKQLGKHIAGSSVFISNFILNKESGYFDISAETKPLLHLWSLGIEEQFYIFWPFILWLAWKLRCNIFGTTLLLTLVSFVLNVLNAHGKPTSTFYSPQTRIWELLLGAILAYTVLHKKSFFEKFSSTKLNFLSILGSVLVLGSILYIPNNIAFPNWLGLLPTFGAIFVIAAGPDSLINKSLLSNKLMVAIGLISFPLYLWHWPLMSFARILRGENYSVSLQLIVILLSFVLAWLTYKFIEKPIRNDTKIANKHMYFSFLLAIVGAVGFFTNRQNGFPERGVAKKASQLIYSLDGIDYKKCSANGEFNNLKINYCLSSPNAEADAVLIGDSHAEDKFHGIFKKDKKRSWLLVGNSSCAPVLGVKVEGDQKECDIKMAKLFDWVIKNNQIKTVALSFFGYYFETESYSADHKKNKLGPENFKISKRGQSNIAREELFYDGLHTAVKLLTSNGKKVIIFIDVPELPFFPRDCLRGEAKCVVEKNQVVQRQQKHRQMLTKLKEQFPSISLFDPLQLFCGTRLCVFEREDVILYRDSHHLTLGGSNSYADLFLAKFSNI